ncbi:leucine-rich repeat domain-containing protein [Treponema denticola]|uniref:leucine-rich repeat domain-containing protein n=1 Tax=Treponema denticola TaxID=158 RepID=UPI003D6E342B
MRQRVKTILFIGLALIALFGMTACPQKAKPKAEEPAPPPGPQKVTFSVEGTPANGELKAMAGSTPITSGKKVPYGTTVTFTATVTAAEHYADEWTIKGGSFKTGGKDGDTTATVQITGETEVKVNFSRYKSVAFGTDGSELDAYLNSGTPAADGIYYIKVTGLKAEHLKGDYNIGKPSPLAKILKDNGTKKVALKFGKLPAVTDMTACFSDCKNLIKAPELPSTVTTMESCFYECKGLTQAPEIPESVTNMGNCFNGCTNLTQISPFPANAKVTNMNGCFVECENLTQVPALPASVTDITNCFKKCKNLTQAPEIPASVTQMTNCFYECVKLTKAPSTIPKGVTNLHSCFFNCRKLTKAPVIPKSVTYMKYCFKFCGELTEVTLECNYVNDDFKEAFFSCNKLTAGTIKVPADQVDAYKAGADDMGTQPDRFVAAP